MKQPEQTKEEKTAETVCAKCGGKGFYTHYSDTKQIQCSCRITKQPEQTGVRELIKTIIVNDMNLKHIASTGIINGTLLVEIERVVNQYASQKCKALQEENEMSGYRSRDKEVEELKKVIQVLEEEKQIASDMLQHRGKIIAELQERLIEYERQAIRKG